MNAAVMYLQICSWNASSQILWSFSIRMGFSTRDKSETVTLTAVLEPVLPEVSDNSLCLGRADREGGAAVLSELSLELQLPELVHHLDAAHLGHVQVHEDQSVGLLAAPLQLPLQHGKPLKPLVGLK